MKRIIIITMSLIFSYVASQQILIEKVSASKYSTAIEFESYKLIKPETLYDIAINYAYTKSVSNDENTKFINYPTIIINNQTIAIEKTKFIKPEDIASLKWVDGLDNTVYGTNGIKNGVLYIKLE